MLQPSREIEKLARDAILAAQEAGELPAFDAPPLVVERPQREEHGDYATTAGLQLAGVARMPPMRIADIIASRIPEGGFLSKVEAAPPGFVNFSLDEHKIIRL